MTALPATCGACEHYAPTRVAPVRANQGWCGHPFARDGAQSLLRVMRYQADLETPAPPPALCPLRRAEEIRAAREAGQVEGFRAGVEKAVDYWRLDSVRGDEIDVVCAEARAREGR